MRHPELAVFLPDLAQGGAQRVTLNLAESLATDGMHVTLLVADAAHRRHFEIPAGVDLVDLGRRHATSALPALARRLRRHPPQAILAALDHANVVAIAASLAVRPRPRTVIVVHNIVRRRTAHDASRRARLLRHLIPMAYRRAHVVVAVSRPVAAELVEIGVPAQLIRVIPNVAVDERLVERAAEPLEGEALAAVFAGDRPAIVAAGRLHPQKDYPTLLRAFAILRRSAEARLVIMGDGAERGALEAEIQRLRLTADVVLAGAVSNPYPAMRRAGVFVLSSRFEALPTALIEALALEVPLVTTRWPGAEDVVGPELEGCSLVPVGDAEALAAALRERLASTARPPAGVADGYRRDAVVPRYREALGLAV